MKNSTDDPDGKRFLGPAFSVWDIAQTDLTVHMHLSMVEWLDYEIARSLTLPEGGREVGGLLLGRIEIDSRRRIIIEGLTPVPCEHKLGSAYHLSVSDKRLLRDQMARWRSGPGRDLYVVGYYRSHNREAIALDEEDILLAREYFSNPLSAILVIRPEQIRLGLAALFFCEQGRVEPEPKLEFPLSRTKLAQRAAAVAGASVVELRPVPPPGEPGPVRVDRSVRISEPVPEPAPVRLAALPPEPPPRPRRSLLGPGLASAILGLVLGGLAYKYLSSSATQTDILDSPLTEFDLTAAVEKNSLRISWNKTSPAIAAAKQAVLSIADRGSRTQLTLSAEQLQAGGLVYPNESDDVTVRLRVLTPERETTESARVVRASGQAVPPALQPPGERALAAPAPVRPPWVQPRSEAANLQPPATAVAAPVAGPTSEAVKSAGTDRASSAPEPGVLPPRSETAEGAVQAPPLAAVPAPDPGAEPVAAKEAIGTAASANSSPEIRSSLPRQETGEVNALQTSAAPPSGSAIAQKPSVPPPPPDAPKVAETVRPAEGSARPPVQPAASATETIRSEAAKGLTGTASPELNSAAPGSSGGAVPAIYVGPQPVRRVAPSLPTNLRNLVVAGTQVSIKVHIDAKGTVVGTEPVSKGNRLEEYLSSIAADAARQWRFTPARQGDQNMPSETILHFRFGKE